MKCLKWIFRIILAPIMLAIKLIILVLAFLLSISTSLLSILASLLGMIAVLVFLVDSRTNGGWILLISFLISPYGIPKAADWILSRMNDLWGSIQGVIYQ